MLAFLIFLFPIAVYLTALGNLHRGRHPVVMTGIGDCLGLLFACSGFILVAGPAILLSLYRQAVRIYLIQQAGTVTPWRTVMLNHGSWGLIGYYLLIGAVIAALLWQRRNATIVYNIDPATLLQTLTEVLHEAGLKCAWQGDKLIAVGRGALSGSATKSQNDREQGVGGLTLRLVPFSAMRNACIWWELDEARARIALERLLKHHLRNYVAGDSWLGAILLIIASAIFCFIIATVGVLVVLVAIRGH